MSTPSPWRFSHYVPSGRTDWCSFPGIMVNVHTGESFQSACKAARSTKCEYCAEVKRGDVASISRSGWTDKPTDRGIWLTLTAPGSSLLPWDRDLCTHSSGVRCAGDLGCQVQAVPLALWHLKLGANWSHFVTEVRRSLNSDGFPKADIEFIKTYEPQLRGALHLHSMMRAIGVVSEARLTAAIEKAARYNGFGSQIKIEFVDLSDARTTARIAGYLSKYTTKCADALDRVEVINLHTGEFRPCRLRNWSASAHWGDRMWQTVQRRTTWARAQKVTQDRSAAPAVLGSGSLLDLYQDLYALDGSVAVQNQEPSSPSPL
jgi:hypothetical protein